MEVEHKSELDLTRGNLFIKTFKFCIPLMLTTIFQLLYTTIDLWTVSKFGGGSLSMTAIGSNGSLINLIVTVLVSLSTGANVCISVAKGAQDKEKAERILHTAFVIAFFGGIIFAFIGFFLAPQFLKWMDTPDAIIDKATIYLRIYFLGCPMMVTFNFGSQMLRALGDSKRPLYFLIISGLVNVLFDLVFVIKLDMDVAGVALATIISQGVSAVLVIWWFYYNKRGFVNFRFNKLKIHKEEFIDILKIGLPAGLQGMAFSFPNVLIQSSLYTINSETINGVTIYQNEIITGSSAAGQLEGYMFCMIDAFAVGCVSITGQNYGAKNIKNIKRGYLYSLTWLSIFWSFCAIIAVLFGMELLQIFITDSEGIIVENALLAGRERLLLMSFTYIFDGIMDLNGCYLRGMKKATIPAIITMIGCTGTRILFILTIFKLEYFHTIMWLYAAFPISWILVNIVYLFVVPYVQKRTFNKLLAE